MRSRTLGLALGLSLLLGGCAVFKREQPGPTEPVTAAPTERLVAAYDLRVEAPSELRELLMQHLDLARFREAPADQRLSPSELARLAAGAPEQARQLLETAGYFNPDIQIQREPAGDDGLHRLRLLVQTGPQARVQQVQLDFEGALQRQGERGDARAQALREQLSREWALPAEAGFSQTGWAAAKSALLARARAQGYPLARLSQSQASVQAADNSVSIALRLDSGPLFTLGELQISGLKHQPEQSVRRLAGYQEGQPYDEKTLLDYQERLINTQLFDSIAVEILPEGVAPAPEQEVQQVPVLVKLREAPRRQVTLSLGYYSVDGPSIGLEHVHRRRFGLNLRERTKINLSRDKSSVDMEFSSHPQPDMQRSLGALYLERVKTGEQVDINLRTRVGYARETEPRDRLHYLELLRSWERAPGVQETRASAISLNQQVIWRRLDSKLLPSRGYTASLLLGAGLADSNTETRGAFGRLQAKAYWYQPLPSKWLLSVRSEAGQILARRNLGLPEALRFRTGGDDTVRGYGKDDLGPTDANGNQTGGRVLWDGSVELAHALTPKIPALQGAVFVDAGQAAPHWRDLQPAWAYGLGLRYRSPVGVLRLDMAKGNEADRWRLHFSVAIAL